MSSGKKAYPPLIRGRKYKFQGPPDGRYYVGCLQTVLETVDGYSHCTETDEPVSWSSPPEDGRIVNRLRHGTRPAFAQNPSASAFPFAGAHPPNNPAGQAVPAGQRGVYAALPPPAAGGRGVPGNGSGQYAGTPYPADGRGIHAPARAPYAGAPPGQAAPYNAAHGYMGNPAYSQGNAAMLPPGYVAPNYGTGNTAAPGYGLNYYGAPGAGPSNTQSHDNGGYGAPGNGGAPGGTSSSSGQN
ncbi:uncharacterized protein TRAVEDRAFT_24869 [Trametes versicolor FP-101664 SS1]|uniref:Uncharacterized protein n=1 Tax=Trametes versicolor (strain FP-101664) TaxID=717944 RepID=R7S763_TRAVS|nr:uncharacterized protein TRAVEDRAFT_24869 [Trametes versicolor FP-101664 SS1]EIW51786.1 hypothetical protein TRAVEDRAFT_24869 [Trametes versicolor FP-101664 SS1]